MQGPAPDGYHVPSKDEWVALCGILTTTFSMAVNATTAGTYLKMPLAGYRLRSSSNVNSKNVYGYYWSFTAYSTDNAHILYFGSSALNPQTYSGRANGCSVRCFKNSSVIPTSSWTTLYDGSSVATGAGVFYNATDGLISVSGDGKTWYTIMDKNLGATTVYNQGDTVSDANCGYFYQRGNNYGFAHSGTITTSSTQVDASNYGPGNYYSSSTFIKRGSSPYDWSSVQNDNLWGGVTGVIPTSELKNAYIGGVRVPGANTYGYYTFDDQNASQITDFSGNGNNLTGGTMPSYTLVQGSNYAGNFANVSGSVAPNISIGFGTSYTILVWAKVTTEASMYFTGIQASHQQSIIYGYSSGTFEFYGDNYRTTIKSGASLNTWYLIGYTRSGTSIKTYVNNVAGGTASYYNEALSSGTLHLGSSRDGDRAKGQIGECVIEDKVWTAEEVANYYNLTKGNYGL